MTLQPPPHSDAPELLQALVYELLDAHHDTVELAEDPAEDRWWAHLDYLRALQRKGRELLAQACAADPRPSAGTSR
jgi:hypothetical protein